MRKVNTRTMHNLLHTLEPDQKQRWSEYLSSLVYSYNCTPHATTKYSPYFLFFGREPRLPVDDHLPIRLEHENGDVDSWVQDHYERMEAARKHAGHWSEKEAIRRRGRNPGKANNIPIGSRVFVCSLGHKDRHKIQDIWDSEPYRVLKRPDAHGPVYTVLSLEDPTKIRTVYRKHLLDAKELVPEVHDLSMHSDGARDRVGVSGVHQQRR